MRRSFVWHLSSCQVVTLQLLPFVLALHWTWQRGVCAMRERERGVSRTQVLLTKISQTCQSIRNIKKRKEQLAFHRTSNTLKRTTSYSIPPDHSIPHSSTGDGGVQDDNTKKSSSSTPSSLGGTHSPDTPGHRGPTLPAPDPTPTSKLPSPGRDPRSPLPDDKEGSLPAS